MLLAYMAIDRHIEDYEGGVSSDGAMSMNMWGGVVYMSRLLLRNVIFQDLILLCFFIQAAVA